ncbi:hypothetical protein ACLBXM_17265 [Xanthobacteraceae bacterium A53D]
MRPLIAGLAASLLAAAPMAAPSAFAGGFASRDLTPFAETIDAAVGAGCQTLSEPARVTVLCKPGLGPLIDVSIKRRDANDHIEQNVRTGKTGRAELERLCRQNNPDCTVALLDVEPAVGWLGAQPMGRQALSTAVILRDGDQLTVRALASGPDEAHALMDKTLSIVRPVIGR